MRRKSRPEPQNRNKRYAPTTLRCVESERSWSSCMWLRQLASVWGTVPNNASLFCQRGIYVIGIIIPFHCQGDRFLIDE